MGVFYRLQRTTVNSALLHLLLYALLYIFSEISTYLCDFKRVTTSYHQIFKGKTVLILYTILIWYALKS